MSETVTTHELNCDLLVAGGGPAGLGCALAAARSGAQVILCQDRSVLGGNASSEVRMHIVGANGVGSSERGAELETEAREGGIIEEIRLEACVHNPQRSASMLDLILYDKCRTEPNLTLLLNTSVTGVLKEGNRIQQAIAERQSTEDRFQITASVFVDCTGDGRLALEAGAAYMQGRESCEQFGESLAPGNADPGKLGSTILMQARKLDVPAPFVAPRWARKFTRDQLRLRLYADPGEEQPTHEYGYWWAEWGGTLDTVKENERIRDELHAILLGIWDHIKNGPPGTPAGQDPFDASHWVLDWFGFLPGKRESRRFIGQHVLTEQDVMTSRPFADAIAYGGWSIDLHPPEGIDAPDVQPCVQHLVPYLYDIPLRCCVARDVANLMFAGRNMPATHVAFASTRVMATCFAVGQGVGVAAAHAISRQVEPQAMAADLDLIRQVQQRLLRDDAFLIGQHNLDPADLARCARISASSQTDQGAAENVISAATRCVHGQRGAPPDRRQAGSHRWIADPGDGWPAWIRLDWDAPVSPKEIQLIFDTGLHRHLTLSHHDGYSSRMVWGRPQPETVRDYKIEVRQADRWIELVKVEGNYQRRRVHRIASATSTRELRVVVQASHGIASARICEIRVYGEERTI